MAPGTTGADAWSAEQEIDSLSHELLRSYEELHLLYELGEALTGQLTVAAAAQLVLEHILNALHATWAELRLDQPRAPAYVVIDAKADPAAPREAADDRVLHTTLRGSGSTVGSITLGRLAPEDPFTSGDGKVLDAVGTLAGNALRNAQLYEELVRQSEVVREREAHLRTVLDNVADGIVTVDERGIVESFNPAAERIFGYTVTEIIGRKYSVLLDPASEMDLVSGLCDLMEPSKHYTTRSEAPALAGRRKDGTIFPMEISVSETQLKAQRLYIVSVRDITERRRFEAALEHQALHDLLTDLPNRVLLHDRLQQAILATTRDDKPLALLVMDLDRFKEVNDTFGHHYGDMLLQEVGMRLQQVLRQSDTIARLGGDEFAVVLPATTTRNAAKVASKILKTFERPFVLEGHTVEVGASIGLAFGPEHGADAHTLLRRADVAMYVAKRANGGYAVYDAEQDENSPVRLALLGELRHAIEGQELELYFQPKVDYRTNRIDCVEALVRWHHPRRGLLPPDQFVPLAEQTGLIRQLTAWVLNAALRQCRRWQDEGLTVPVAVNLSMRNLHDDETAELIPRLLDQWQVPTSQLCLEITESSLMVDPARALEALGRLRTLGIHVAIDDFGTGYSSLSYVEQLPISEIKIDKSFIRHVVRSDSDWAIVRSTVSLGHDLGLKVSAEGVEDQATWDLLESFGCDVAQGYFIGRPMDATALEHWLHASSWNVRGEDSDADAVVTRARPREEGQEAVAQAWAAAVGQRMAMGGSSARGTHRVRDGAPPIGPYLPVDEKAG